MESFLAHLRVKRVDAQEGGDGSEASSLVFLVRHGRSPFGRPYPEADGFPTLRTLAHPAL